MISPQNTKKVLIVLVALLFVGLLFSIVVVSIFVLNKEILPIVKDSPLFPSLTPTLTDVQVSVSTTNPTVTPSVIGFPNRLKITLPEVGDSLNQAGGILLVKGEMKGFFEGVMNYRIIDKDGVVLASGIIQAQGDNYEKFVPFEDSVNYGELSSSQYYLEFYDVSMKDGEINLMVRLPL